MADAHVPSLVLDTPFGQVLAKLLLDPQNPARLIGLGHEQAALILEGTRGVALLANATGDLDDIFARAKKGLSQEPVRLVVFGGADDLPQRLAAAVPRFSMNRLGLYHLSTAGALWTGPKIDRDTDRLAVLLAAQGRGGLGPLPDVTALRAKMEADLGQVRSEREEVSRFVEGQLVRVPHASYAILAAIVLMFGLQLALDGDTSTTVMIRMGALVASRIREDGEWWRLLSSAFLHGGWPHILMNGYALFVIGPSVERVLGMQRFLIIYAASALGGGLVSALVVGHELSVGASGAIWGLMCASGFLAFRPSNVIPASVVPALRRATLTNLVINVLISLQPQVDLGAHLGGGLVGGLLVLSGAMTVGVSPVGSETPSRSPLLIRLGAVVSLLALLGCVGTALWVGQPWALADVTLERREVPAVGLSLEVPRQLTAWPEARGGEHGFGDLLHDGRLVAVWATALEPPLDATGIEAQLTEIEQELTKPHEALTITQAPRREVLSGAPVVHVVYGLPNGVVMDQWFRVEPQRLQRLDVYAVGPFAATNPALARRIAQSLR